MTRKLEAGALDPAVLFANLLKQHGVPLPATEVRFDPARRWRFDYGWIEQKLALEVEGGIWTYGRHNRASGYLRDVEKYNRATVLGWRLLRTTPDQLLTLDTVHLLRAALSLSPAA